ncbi:diphosphomevalonate decarboxylase [Candidatus Aenigmatarchaeota archaeon]
MKATALAGPNIALVKYWGKRDKKLMLPNNGSISMTCEGLHTKTTVEFDDKYNKDVFILDDKEFTEGKEYDRVVGSLNLIREKAKLDKKAKVASVNTFPTAAGLASSASGAAALVLAASKAAGLELDEKALSMLARRGSGSASRSVGEGFVEWRRGEKEDGSDCYAETIAKKDHWPEFHMVVAVISMEQKKVKSRAGMAQTVANCPYYDKWLATVNNDLDKIREGIKNKDFTTVGQTAEHNCLKMHATMITTTPPIVYWTAGTMDVIRAIAVWREEGLESYFTIDAGPQVKIMCLEKDEQEIVKRLKEIGSVKDIVLCKPGDGARIVDEHLF